ncbi:NAD-dependent epimerase/dehydratase family protein [Gilvimarinus chinensis]|uniref:NAD-dependent epimerase/dehydratase family protein n=1 Tax=Gilvimarinus chinensis TaxID=396005 RepID=UPI0003611240|nr:NAD-dependent epimerase/dehydratase family protein [Gilvimarinus chinensis]
MTKILLTGGCGFIGSNLGPLLIDQGFEVTILDNFSKGDISYLPKHDQFEIIEADIGDEEAVYNAAKGKDAVIHLAALGSVVESVVNPNDNFISNAEGTFKVLNAARRAGIKRCVFASTGGAIMGNTPPPVNETSLPKPISPYGASKLAGEGYCSAFSHAYDMNITALRFANVIGPISAHKKGAITVFIRALMNNKPITIFGDGKATRDFLFVKDLCKGIVSALIKNKPGFNVYHLASGEEVSVKQLAKTLCEVAEKPDHEIRFESKRKGEVERNFADYKKAKEELGFLPSFTLDEALKITWNWFLEHEGPES